MNPNQLFKTVSVDSTPTTYPSRVSVQTTELTLSTPTKDVPGSRKSSDRVRRSVLVSS